MFNPGIDEIKPSELNVKQYEPKSSLNDKFWKDGKLDSRIRLRLLDISDDFIEGLNIGKIKPVDIVFTGSLANYNWHKASDIDIHIIIDYSLIHKNLDFVKDYFDSKKEMWMSEHDTLTMKGFPVEFYVEDENGRSDPSGAYSLTKGEWIRKPVDSNDIRFNENLVRNKAAKYITMIDDICDEIDNETDRHKSEVLSEKLEKIFDKLKNIRKEGLKSSKKEMSTGNILWKVIKHHGSIKRLWDSVNKSYDLVNSIDESKETLPNITQLKDGTYKAYFYDWVFELEDGRKFMMNYGVRRSKRMTPLKTYTIRNGKIISENKERTNFLID